MIVTARETQPVLRVEDFVHADAFPHAARLIEVVDRSAYWMVLAGRFAYQICKPLKSNLLDWSTPQLRRQVCDDLVARGRTIQSPVILGVVPISMVHSSLRFEDGSNPVDYAIKLFRQSWRMGALFDPQETSIA